MVYANGNHATGRPTLKVNSPNLKYTDDALIADYVYRTTKTKVVDNEIIAEPVETKYTFRTERKVPRLGYIILFSCIVSLFLALPLAWH
jgi:hypothetical protein